MCINYFLKLKIILNEEKIGIRRLPKLYYLISYLKKISIAPIAVKTKISLLKLLPPILATSFTPKNNPVRRAGIRNTFIFRVSKLMVSQ